MREGARAHEMDDRAASKMEDSAQIRSQSINQSINQASNQGSKQKMGGTSRRVKRHLGIKAICSESCA